MLNDDVRQAKAEVQGDQGKVAKSAKSEIGRVAM
jgi:hypothetical protein